MFKNITSYYVEMDYMSSRGGSREDQIGTPIIQETQWYIAWIQVIAIECIRWDQFQDILQSRAKRICQQTGYGSGGKKKVKALGTIRTE